MNLLLQKTFERRGYEFDFFDRLYSIGHVLPGNVDQLCEALSIYRKDQKLLVLLTDFDMDGIMCGVEGYAGLSELGFSVALWLPDVSFYGFNRRTIDAIRAMYPNVSGILTGDVGVTCFDGIAYAKSLGLDVFVTDHHLPKSSLPDGNVVVDPYLGDQEHAFPEICGAYVLYQVLRYFAEHYMEPSGYYVQQIERLRMFAGLGTISDGMPLFYENRPLVLDCVRLARFVWDEGQGSLLSYVSGCDVYRRAFFGFYQLLSAFHDAKKFTTADTLDETFFAYYVAPCFNSIKRMDGNIQNAYDVFFGSQEHSLAAIKCLFSLTEKRKRMTKAFFAELKDSTQPWAPYVYITEAASGLRGLLAQQLLSETGEPVFVVAYEDGGYSGSGRCPSWFSMLRDGFHSDVPAFCHSWWAAGHPQAFGFGISDEAALDEFVAFLKEQISKLKPAEEELVFQPDYVISTFGDGDTEPDPELFADFLYELPKLHPFGSGFPEPEGRICFSRQDVESVQVMGSDHNHIKFLLEQRLTIICFFQAELFSPNDLHRVSLDSLPDRIEVTGKLGYNVFRGRRNLQFVGSVTELSDVPVSSAAHSDYEDLLCMLREKQVQLAKESEVEADASVDA